MFKTEKLVLVDRKYAVTQGTKISGARLTFEPLVDAKIKVLCLKYWLRLFPSKDGRIEISTLKGRHIQYKLIYDGCFHVEAYNQWLSDRGLRHDRLNAAFKDTTINKRLKKLFVQEINVLKTSFDLFPTDEIVMHQLSMFRAEGEISKLLKKGTAIEYGKLTRFLQAIEPMKIAIAIAVNTL